MWVYEKRSNAITKRQYYKPDILSFIKIKRLERFGRTCTEIGRTVDLCSVLANEIHKTIPLRRLRQTRWIDVVIKDLSTIGSNATFVGGESERDGRKKISMAG